MTEPPTGPLTDHEIAHTLAALPDHFTAVRLAKEVASLRQLFRNMQEIVYSEDTVDGKWLRMAVLLGEWGGQP